MRWIGGLWDWCRKCHGGMGKSVVDRWGVESAVWQFLRRGARWWGRLRWREAPNCRDSHPHEHRRILRPPGSPIALTVLLGRTSVHQERRHTKARWSFFLSNHILLGTSEKGKPKRISRKIAHSAGFFSQNKRTRHQKWLQRCESSPEANWVNKKKSVTVIETKERGKF